MARKPALGKGLDALLGDVTVSSDERTPQNDLIEVAVDSLQPNPHQPRTAFDAESVTNLAESIRQQGVMQPVLVRRLDNGSLQIVSGERRWRAAKQAGLEAIPAIERQVTDQDAVVLALVENLQREDLSPYEAAVAMQRLQEDYGMPQEQIAALVGRSRATISNSVRLLGLHKTVLALLKERKIEEAAARTLLALPMAAQPGLARRIVERGYSVRQVEEAVKRIVQKKPLKSRDPDVLRLEEELADALGAAITITRRGKRGGGTLKIQYRNLEQLQSLVSKLTPK